MSLTASPLMADDAYWDKFPDVLSLAQVEEIVRRKKQTLYRWLGDGLLPAHLIGGVWVVYKEALRLWIEEEGTPHRLPEQLLSTYPDELSALQLAELVGKTRQTVYNLLEKKALKGHFVAGSWLLYKSEFVDTLRATSSATRRVNKGDQ